MLIKLHGIFAERYGDEHYIEADTVAEAIEGFGRQVNFYTELLLDDRPLCRVVGFYTEESFYEKTEQKEIHLVPAMIGGGPIARIVIGVNLIAASILVNAIPGVGQVLSPILMSLGISMILGGIMQLFSKAPTVNKDKDPEASKYLSFSDNTVEIGTVIPLQYGRGPATGHILAVNVDSDDMIVGNFPTTPT